MYNQKQGIQNKMKKLFMKIQYKGTWKLVEIKGIKSRDKWHKYN